MPPPETPLNWEPVGWVAVAFMLWFCARTIVDTVWGSYEARH
jgi:hypothetical protein